MEYLKLSDKVLVECGRGHVLEVKEHEVYTNCPICEIGMRKKMYKIYIAAGMGNKAKVHFFANNLQNIGHEVISSWDYKQQETSEANALKDLEEIDEADCVIFLTNTKSTEGGRYIEQGYALALKRSGKDIKLILCGPRESCFDYLSYFEKFDNEEELLNAFEREYEAWKKI